jgi:23S rRNA (guanine745-N1)-methyltransferase
MSTLSCPNCQSILQRREKVFNCQNGHSFDVAKDGYINLLLPNQKKKPNPGDNKIMMNARETFLSKGHYDFLIDFIESSIKSNHKSSDTLTNKTNLIDLGCGTGYYTRNLFRESEVNKIGIDISKSGVSIASRKDKYSTYVVSSIFDIPIADNTIDTIVNIFSPLSIDEVKRVLKPGGYFYKVIPAEDHMNEIASLVYDEFIPHQSSVETDLSNDSELQIIKVEKLEQKLTFADENLYNLIAMTPYLYKFDKDILDQLKELLVTISFKVIIAISER